METILAYLIFFAACSIPLGLLFQVTVFASLFLGLGSSFRELASIPLVILKRAPLVVLPFALFYLAIVGAAIKIASLCWPYL